MVSIGGGGIALGVAHGKITLDYSGFTAAQRAVTSGSREMADSAKRAGLVWDENAKRFRDSAGKFQTYADSIRTGTASISQSLNKLANDFALLSAAAAGLSAIGIQNAATTEQLNLRFQNLLGSQEAASAQMERLGQLARQLNAPVQQVQRSFAQLLPILKNDVDETERYLGLAARLATLNPGEGIAGATFAIGEALSSAGSDFVSLSERFQISKVQLRELVAETGSFAGGLDAVLNRFGATDASLKQSGQTFTVAITNAQAALAEALGTGFGPILEESITPALNSLTGFLRELKQTNPEILKLVAGVSLVAAGIAPMAFAVNALASGFSTLKDAVVVAGTKLKDFATSATGQRVIGGGLAVAGGVGVGLAGANALASAGVRSGDLGRIADGEDAGAILAERLKQIVVIVANAFIEIARGVTFAGAFLLNAFDQILNVFKYGANIMTGAFALFERSIGDLLVGLADAFSGVTDTTGLRLAGQGVQTSADTKLQSATEEEIRLRERLNQGLALTVDQTDSINSTFDTFKANILGGLTNILFPSNAPAAPNDDIVIAAAESTSGLNRVLQTLGSTLLENRSALREYGFALEDLTQDFAEDAERIRTARDIAAAREQFDFDLNRERTVNEFNRQQAVQEANFLDERADKIEAFAQQSGDMEAQALANRLRQQANFQREEARRFEDHGIRLTDIQLQTQRSVETAARRLDASGVFDALQSGRDQTTKENQTFGLETARRAEDFALQQTELDANLAEQRDARTEAFNQQLADEQLQHDTQRELQISEFEQRLVLEDADRALRAQRQAEDFAREDAARVASYNKKISDLVAATTVEAGLYSSWLQSIGSAWQGARDTTAAYVQQIAGMFSGLSGGTIIGPMPAPVGGTGGTDDWDNMMTDFYGTSGLSSSDMVAAPSPLYTSSTQQSSKQINIGTFAPVLPLPADIGYLNDERLISALQVVVNTGFGQLFGGGQ